MFAVLKDFHPMFGYDLHIPWLIGTPAPAPAPVPYFTFMVLAGVTGTYSRAVSHKTTWGTLVQKGSDIGPLIPHIGPPSYLLPLDILFSASKSYFGTTEYKVEGKPAAVAVLFVVNLNLNCGTPFPKRPGVVLAFNTHFAGMTWGDFFHGLLSGLIDWALQYLLNKALGKFGDWFAKKLAPVALTKSAVKGMITKAVVPKGMSINEYARRIAQANVAKTERLMALFPKFMRPGLKVMNPVVNAIGGTISGFFVGGPLGMDASAVGVPTPGGGLTSGAQDYLNNNVVDEFGNPPPPPPQQPPPPRRPPSIGPRRY